MRLLADHFADDLRQRLAVSVAPRQSMGEKQGQPHREIQMPPCPLVSLRLPHQSPGVFHLRRQREKDIVFYDRERASFTAKSSTKS
jgi:hypothetical protein